MGGSLVLLVLFMALFYFVLFRPQQRRMKEHQQLVASLEPGDDVLTNGGLYGTITAIDGQIAEMEIADGIVVRIQRGAIAELIEWDDGTDDLDGDE